MDNEEIYLKENKIKDFHNFNYKYKVILMIIIIIIFLNSFAVIYLLNKVNKIDNLISSLIINENDNLKINTKNKNGHQFNIYNKFDKDMVGLEYPKIEYESFYRLIINKNITYKLLADFLRQLEIKLLYLEKEINVTKLYSFYHIRKAYLEKNKIYYDDWNTKELHNIISWLAIHKSTQLKGIASDKYIACKYVKLKLGINLCKHRLGVYNNPDEINYEELCKKKNIVLKISNGCHDLVYIREKCNINLIKQKVKYYFDREYNLKFPSFFHLYSTKRIISEKIFTPFSDLYEFKIWFINRKIVYIKLWFADKNKRYQNYYDQNFEIISFSNNHKFNIKKMFSKDLLNKLIEYAYKLTEDFQNFIRVDLYIFHENIYLSELTFDSNEGKPFLRHKKMVIEAGKNWKRIE